MFTKMRNVADRQRRGSLRDRVAGTIFAAAVAIQLALVGGVGAAPAPASTTASAPTAETLVEAGASDSCASVAIAATC